MVKFTEKLKTFFFINRLINFDVHLINSYVTKYLLPMIWVISVAVLITV